MTSTPRYPQLIAFDLECVILYDPSMLLLMSDVVIRYGISGLILTLLVELFLVNSGIAYSQMIYFLGPFHRNKDTVNEVLDRCVLHFCAPTHIHRILILRHICETIGITM